VRRLKNVAYIAVQPELRSLPGIPPIDEKLTLSGFIEAADEVDQRGFAGSGLADDGDICSMRYLEVKVLKNILIAVRVAERNIPEFNIADELFPVLLLRMERITVFLNDFRAVGDVGFFSEKFYYALDIGLN
jgi:hypothetical protein